MITVTSVEAQNRFGQLLDTVQREPVTITRHGRTVAVLMSQQAAEAQRQSVGADAARQAGLAAIANFRAARGGGSVAQLLQDRQADRQAEARKEQPSKSRRKANSKIQTPMPRYVLDTSALLTLYYTEPGSERVAGLLTQALEPETSARPGVAVFACFMSLMEVLYRVWKTEGEAAGRAAYAACQALPVMWVHETPALLELAASLKALYPMSLGDAWIAATALQCNAVLVHKDPEFENLPGLVEERLPYK